MLPRADGRFVFTTVLVRRDKRLRVALRSSPTGQSVAALHPGFGCEPRVLPRGRGARGPGLRKDTFTSLLTRLPNANPSRTSWGRLCTHVDKRAAETDRVGAPPGQLALLAKENCPSFRKKHLSRTLATPLTFPHMDRASAPTQSGQDSASSLEHSETKFLFKTLASAS